MSKTFRAWDVDQVWLFPPSVQDFVPARHMAHFVRETVRGELDLGAIMASYVEERGYPPYHPAMMVALLLYGYSRGVYSSRQLERACEERVDFMAVTGMSPGRARHGAGDPGGRRRWRKGSRVAAMATKLSRAGRRSRYRLRKQIVEPVFGQIKAARAFRQFLLRGLDQVRDE